MKKWMILAAVGVLAINMASCKPGGGESKGNETETSQVNESSQAEAGQETSGDGAETVGEEIPNPFQELEGPEGLKELGLNMEAPENASNIQYISISGEIGEVFFELDGHRYSYRGAAHAEEFSGIFEEFEQETTALSDCGADEDLIVKTTVSGGRLASWSKGGAKYTLYTADAVEDEVIFELCISLIGKN
ncbi:MAG: hypothetical protein HFG49_14930 [Lachnospiraceae bacterium]|nr:hypothetical protein [Lachnospiraceae bacterium]